MSKNIVCGIDLGTTYSCIAYMDSSNKAVVIKNAESEPTTPSVVFFEDKENVTVGELAKENAKLYPDKVVTAIKRSMGKDGGNRTIDGITRTPSEISSYILKKLVSDAEDTLRQENVLGDEEHIKNVVITCPAYFGMNQRKATKEAGEIAQLNVLHIINEPTAAAISYGVTDDAAQEKTVMVYDLGGGTFDVTMIRITPKPTRKIEVICTGGDQNLGGKDWDEAVMMYLDNEFQKGTGTSTSILDDPETLQTLMIDVEKIKKILSFKTKAPLTINAYGKRFRTELTREKFDEITEPLIDRTIGFVSDIFKEAEKKGVSKDKVDEILLVGGSSRMPQVKTKLAQSFPNISLKMYDPDESVAKGAAIYATRMDEFNQMISDIAGQSGLSAENIKNRIANGESAKSIAQKAHVNTEKIKFIAPSEELDVTNVTSRSFGTEAFDTDGDKWLYNIIKKNTQIPAVGTDEFCPVKENQRDAQFDIFEDVSSDDRVSPETGNKIGKAILKLPEGCTRDTHIKVKFILDEDGLLKIDAEEVKEHHKVHAEIRTKDFFTPEEKTSAIRRVKKTKVE